MTPMPGCESSGLINLCGVGTFLTQGWFTIQASNLVWFLVLAAIIGLAIALPFPAHALDDDAPGHDAEVAL